MRLALLLVIAVSVAAAEADPPPEPVELPVRQYVGPGRWRTLPAPNGVEDPVPALAGDEPPSLVGDDAKKPTAKDIAAFVAGYVDRIEAYELGAAKPPAGFAEWLRAHPTLRREFWLALSPQFDDAAKAIAVLDALRGEAGDRIDKYAQLAIAVAVVWDQPDAVISSRYDGIWGVAPAQFPEPPTFSRVFAYFGDDKHQAAFPFRTDTLPWPLLVHLVDVDLSDDELAWAQKKIEPHRGDIAGLYPLVPYDYDKLGGRTPKLGEKPYVLENLLACGGVCGDQAYFTSRSAKAFGIPAMKVTGEGRYGATSLHAWAGFLTAAKTGGKPRPVLEFTGRYNFDFYYTGDVFDPQTRTTMLDRSVAMLYDGASASYPGFVEARALARAAAKLADAKPAASLALARAALDRNRYCAEAWRIAMAHVASGRVPRREAMELTNRMMRELAEHPDLTLECLPAAMSVVPATEVDARQELYEHALALYAKRPDLQIRLRRAQCDELVAAGRQPKALERALETITANAKEGSLILPLVEQVVDAARKFAASTPSFRVDVVRNALAKVDTDFPKQRGNEPSAAYEEFKRLVGSL